MSQVAAILFRLMMVVLGFGTACVAASGFLHLVWVGPLAADQGVAEFFYSGPVFVTVAMLALMIGYVAFLPWLIVLVVAELTGRRGWLFYALAGAVIAAPVAGVLWIGLDDREVDLDFLGLSIVGAGILGGFGYWLVAGRAAGLWWREGRPVEGVATFGRSMPPK